jgi:hypothetical protein
MAARVLEVADEVGAVLQAEWEPTAPDVVERMYGAEFGLTPGYEPLLEGRRLMVYPATYEHPELETRSKYRKEFVLKVCAAERYLGNESLPPKAWMDERVSWFEEKVFLPLRDQHLLLLESLVPSLSQPATVDEVYDIAKYFENKTFWSTATVAFQEIS